MRKARIMTSPGWPMSIEAIGYLPPQDHGPDCLCQHCFEIHVGRESYSLRVLSAIAKSSIGVVGPDTTTWLIWLLNRHLPYPVSEKMLFEILEGATSVGYVKRSLAPTRIRTMPKRSEKALKKRIQVEL